MGRPLLTKADLLFPVFFHSRMESTGVPGRIHVSEETAKEVREAGKGDWLTPRQDKVRHSNGVWGCNLISPVLIFSPIHHILS